MLNSAAYKELFRQLSVAHMTVSRQAGSQACLGKQWGGCGELSLSAGRQRRKWTKPNIYKLCKLAEYKPWSIFPVS
jgi:hypothetical protein